VNDHGKVGRERTGRQAHQQRTHNQKAISHRIFTSCSESSVRLSF
jgi:hypothetical protein